MNSTTQTGIQNVPMGKGNLATASKKALTKQPAKVGRLMVSFWLDISKQSEHDLNEHIRMLKKKRMFSYSIRAGLALLKDLREGKTDVLCEMFPWIKSRLQPAPTDQFTVLLNQVAQLQQQLAQVSASAMPAQLPSLNTTFALPEPQLMEADTEPIAPIVDTHSRSNFDASIAGMFDDDDE